MHLNFAITSSFSDQNNSDIEVTVRQKKSSRAFVIDTQ